MTSASASPSTTDRIASASPTEQWDLMHSILWGAHDWPEGAVLAVSRMWGDDRQRFGLAGCAPIDDVDATFTLIERTDRTATGTYMMVGGLAEAPATGRGKATDVVGLPALFIDADTADGAHAASSDGLPHPTRAQVAEMLASTPWGPPSLVVNSGGGVHAYWATYELLDPNAAEGRETLAAWDAWWTAEATSRGYAWDAGVARDAARVLRPAGTMNRKRGGEGVPVTIEDAQPGRRYDVDDIVAYLPAPDVAAPVAATRTKAVVAEDASDRPGDRLARSSGALVALLIHLGLRPADRTLLRWIYPRPSGDFSRADTHAEIKTVEGVERLKIHGARMQADWATDIHTLTAWDVLIQRLCAGDAGLAARIVARHDADIDAILDAINDLDADSLASEYPLAPARSLTVSATGDLATIPAGEISTTSLPDPRVASEVVGCARTDLGIAERWGAYFGLVWRWTSEGPTGGSWRRWDGRVWLAATEAAVIQTIVTTLRQGMQREELKHIAPASGDEPFADRMATARSEHIGAAMSFESASRLRAVASLLHTLPGVSVPLDAWDADDDVLNAQDGLVDLRTGELRPHHPAAMCTKIALGSGRSDIPVSADLQTVLDGYALTDPELPEWFQTMAGVSCTGRSPRLFAHVWGVPNAGKSTVLGALLMALGGGQQGVLKGGPGYATTVGIGAIQTTAGGAPQETLQALEGMRMVGIDEAAHAGFDPNLVKMISSGELIESRANYGSARAWRSHVTLLMFGNGELRLPSTDAGLINRFYPCHFTKRPEVLDEGLVDRLRTPEALDVVLAWAIRGSVAWYARGGGQAALQPPACVLAGREKYLADVNPLTTWLTEHVEVIPEDERDGLKGVAMLSELRVAYARWARSTGQRATVGDRAFPDYLEAAGHPADQKATTSRSGEVRPRNGRFVRSLRTPETHYTGDQDF